MKRALIVGLALGAIQMIAGETAGLRKAPELAFNIPGQGQRLLSQYRGRVIAIEFIMTTCPHCQAASKDMTKLQAEFGPRGFQALDLAINGLDGTGGPPEADGLVTQFAQNFNVGFPVGWLPRAEMMSFMNFTIMDRMVVPQLVLIDRKGMIHYQTPAISGPEWEKLMNPTAVHEHIEELLSMSPSESKGRSKGTKMAAAQKQK